MKNLRPGIVKTQLFIGGWATKLLQEARASHMHSQAEAWERDSNGNQIKIQVYTSQSLEPLTHPSVPAQAGKLLGDLLY